jgi:plasmid stabilization system protein ParE
VATVRLTRAAVDDLEELIVSHELPGDTPRRIRARLRSVGRFPRMGRQLDGVWAGTRYLLGPWPWLVIVYEYDEAREAVTVLTIQDARQGSSPTAR